MKVDLHMHTDASDGTWDVVELKKELMENKINIFSITDHDSIDNIKNMKNILKGSDSLVFIPGTELTCQYEGREYHLTLYNFDIDNEDLLKLIKWTNNNKLSSNEEYIGYASNKYECISSEEYKKYEYDRKRGGWKSANYMIDKGIHKDIPEHLKDVYKSGLKAKLKSPEEVINIAKKSGGKIFLAHPSYHYKDSVMPMEELKFWAEVEIDGIECFSPYNTDSRYYRDFCKKNNLMISGGSDCHGKFIPARKLGMPDITLDDLNIKKMM